jgi:WD40 repeat protein
MDSAAKTSVFISYARNDGADLARRLHGDLKCRGFRVWLDTREIHGGASWTKEIEQALDRCDVLLALLTAGSYVSEVCRAEQLRALRYRKCVIPLRAQSGAEILPLHLETKNYRDFTTSYEAGLATLLTDIGERNSVALKEEFRVTYVTAPSLPPNYIERPEALQALRDVIFSQGADRTIAITALEGMSGIGKSVLAAALCDDEVVQQAFPDGIAWVIAGRESTYDLVTKMREVGKTVDRDYMTQWDNELGCKNRYRTVMREKAALIVIDDVWNARDLEPFRVWSPRSRLLFTTRDTNIAAATGAHEYSVSLMRGDQAHNLLAKASGTPDGPLPPQAEDLIRECGRLPLAVGMIGAMLRGKPLTSWLRVLNHLRHADLDKIKVQFPGYPHTDLLRAIQVSVEALDEISRRRYLALAVLLEDMPVHPAIAQTLWNVEEAEAEETAELFVSLSLAQRERDSCRLHDLQLDYVRAQYPEKPTLALIHDALRLSSHVIAKDPTQFASQVVGRLLPYQDQPAIRELTSAIAEGAPLPWLRPLHPVLHPPGTALVRTFEGHSSGVNGVAISADGRRAISASYDNTLKVWDLESGRELRTLVGHLGSVRGVAISPDGALAVSASDDKTLKVWDLDAMRELRTLEGHSGAVNGVAVRPDGGLAVSASDDETLKVWDLNTGCELRTLQGHSGAVNGVVIRPDGELAVSASGDKTLKVWDLHTGCELRTLEGHSDWVRGVAISPDGGVAVSASDDKTLQVWDLQTGCELRTLRGHSGAITGVAISPDARRVVSASFDNTLKVWDLDSARELRTLQGHSREVLGVAISPDGRRAVSASSDKTLKVWDLDSARELRTLQGHLSWVNGVAISPDGRLAISASADNTLKVWDLQTARELGTLQGHCGSVNGVAISPDGRLAVSPSDDETLKVWDLDSGRELRTLQGHSDWVHGVAISPDGRRVVSASADKTLKVWDLDSGRELRTLQGHSGWVFEVAISPDGRLAVSASYDKTLKVWDLDSGRQLRTLEGHTGWVGGVAISPDGQRAVSASADKTLKVWDLDSGRALRTLQGHSGEVRGVAISPDGRRAISASNDNALKVWDLDSGRVLATLICDANAGCCAFADNHRIVGGDSAGRMYFLSLELAPEDFANR